MTIETVASMSGVVVLDPETGTTRNGEPYLRLRVGQEHAIPKGNGTYIRRPMTYATVSAYGDPASQMATEFAKNDRIIALGEVHTYTGKDRDGNPAEREEFRADTISHDTSYPSPDVDSPAQARQTPTVPAGPDGPDGPTNTAPIPPAGRTGRGARADAVSV